MDEPGDRTILNAVRDAARGKIGERGADRRRDDRLALKDWIAYVLIVAGPVAATLWATHQTVTRLEIQVERLEADIERAEHKREQIWSRLGGHVEGHP